LLLPHSALSVTAKDEKADGRSMEIRLEKTEQKSELELRALKNEMLGQHNALKVEVGGLRERIERHPRMNFGHAVNIWNRFI